jgi:hypothetical protein
LSTVTAEASEGGGIVNVYSVGTASSQTQTVVLTGAVGDAGTLSVTGAHDTIILSKGTLIVDLTKGAAAENKLFAHLRAIVNPKSCSMNRSYTAPVKVLSGTGAYARMTGSFVIRTAEVGVFPRTDSGSCDLGSSSQPVGFLSIGQGSGTMHS